MKERAFHCVFGFCRLSAREGLAKSPRLIARRPLSLPFQLWGKTEPAALYDINRGEPVTGSPLFIAALRLIPGFFPERAQPQPS